MIEDDSEEPSRVGTPAPTDTKSLTTDEKMSTDAPAVAGAEVINEKAEDETSKPLPPVELPTDVRSKLRKLEKLESRYQGVLSISVWNLSAH